MNAAIALSVVLSCYGKMKVASSKKSFVGSMFSPPVDRETTRGVPNSFPADVDTCVAVSSPWRPVCSP